jgi:hypothetical protein
MNSPDPATMVSPPHPTDEDGLIGTPIPSAAPLAVGAEFGRYRVVRAVGVGGMGQVYETIDTELNRPVALKVMRTELAADAGVRERFLKEARALASVSNDHVVTIHTVGEHDGLPFLVMELLAGETLDTRMRRGPLAMIQVLKFGREVAHGLAAAHRAGVVHRDVKPDNVVIEAVHDRATLIDFGLAHTGRVGQAGSRQTVGTPLYMAPEQVRGQPVDARTDLFSFGVVLYRMVTGRLPFEGPSIKQWQERLLHPDPPEPVERLNPAVPPPLADLIRRLLSKDPAGRPQSAADVEWELLPLYQSVLAASQSGVVLSPTRSLPGRSSAVAAIPLPARRRVPNWVWWGGGLAVAYTAALVSVLFFTRPLAEPTAAATPAAEPVELFNGHSLRGWHGVDGKTDQWAVRNGVLVGTHRGRTKDGKDGDQFLLTDREFTDYELAFEFRWPGKGGHTTVLLRARDDGTAVVEDPNKDKYRVSGLELNLGDDGEELPGGGRKPLNPLYASGGFFKLTGPNPPATSKPVGEWNAVTVTLVRSHLRVNWNGVTTFDHDLDQFDGKAGELRALARCKGAVALRTHSGRPIEFRKLTVTPK